MDPASLDVLRSYLEDFWTDALARFKKAAESRGQYDGGWVFVLGRYAAAAT